MHEADADISVVGVVVRRGVGGLKEEGRFVRSGRAVMLDLYVSRRNKSKIYKDINSSEKRKNTKKACLVIFSFYAVFVNSVS